MKRSSVQLTFRQISISIWLLTAFSTISLSACAQKKIKASPKISVVLQDDSLKKNFGDSIFNVLFINQTSKCYQLTTDKPKDGEKTIGGFKVINDKTLTINQADTKILQFLLSDIHTYITGPIYPSVPFIPNIAVEFTNKKDKIDLVFSFTGGQYALVVNGETKRYLKYTNEEQILTYFQRLLCKKDLMDLIEKQ